MFRARLHLPRRSPDSGANAAAAPAPAPASDPGLQRPARGAGADPAGEARREADPAPILLRPAPVRHANPDVPPGSPTRESASLLALAAPGLLPDEPAVAPEDVERPLRLVLVEDMPEEIGRAHV